MRTVSSVSPCSWLLTITLRRRCRSMPTYCCCCSTGISFRRLRVGVVTPSVLCTLGPGRREDSRGVFGLASVFVAFLVPTRALLVLGVRAGALTSPRHAGAALRSFITSGVVCAYLPGHIDSLLLVVGSSGAIARRAPRTRQRGRSSLHIASASD